MVKARRKQRPGASQSSGGRAAAREPTGEKDHRCWLAPIQRRALLRFAERQTWKRPRHSRLLLCVLSLKAWECVSLPGTLALNPFMRCTSTLHSSNNSQQPYLEAANSERGPVEEEEHSVPAVIDGGVFWLTARIPFCSPLPPPPS